MMMKLITMEEAKREYYPKNEGESVVYANAYTLTPDPHDPEFELVHYWIKRHSFDVQLSFNEGYIYVLENKGQPGILKIGYTDRTPQSRLKEINGGTGVITPWYIINSFACKAPSHIEGMVHTQLWDYHVNKEGFAVTPKMAEDVIIRIIGENNAGI
jgi:hypothetical protein